MIAVAIASFGRENLLRRLLISLRDCPSLAESRVIIVNNSIQPFDEMLRETGWPEATVLTPSCNLGCAGGVAWALEEGLRDGRVRQIMVVDDDAILAPEAPGKLLEALDSTGGALAVPMVTNAKGEVAWFPGLLSRDKWRVIKRPGLRPEDYLSECGPEPERFSWSAWPVMMITREALEICGLPMCSLWYQAVDIEFSMRVTKRLSGHFVPVARATHLPPPIRLDHGFFLRECGGLQNSLYIVLRLPHGRRALRHLPGNIYRFFRCWGVSPRVVANVARAFWWGAIRGKPQGAPGFDRFRKQWEQETTAS